MEKLLLLLKNKKSRNFFIYGIGQGFNLVSPLLVVPHIIAVSGEEGLGKIGFGFAMALFLILIVDYSFEVKGTKEVAENSNNRIYLQNLFSITVFTKFLLFCLAFSLGSLCIYTIPFFYGEEQLFLLSMTIVFAQVFNPTWFLQGLEDYTIISLLNIFSKSLYVVLVYLLVKDSGDYILVNLYLGLSAFLFNLTGLMVIRYKHKIATVKPAFNEVKTILKDNAAFCISQLFLSVRQLSPIVIIGFFLGYYVAGQYKLIEQIVSLFRTLVQVFLRYFYPISCYKYAESKPAGFSFWKKYTVSGFAGVTALSVIILIFPEEILMFFNASHDTIKLLTPLVKFALLICILMPLSLALEQLMFITGNNKSYTRVAITVTLISVIMVLALVPHYAILGSIIALIAAEVLFITLYFKNSYLHLSRKQNQ